MHTDSGPIRVYTNSLDPAALRRVPARIRPGIVPPAPRKPPANNNRPLSHWATFIGYFVNGLLIVSAVFGVISLIGASDEKEKFSVSLKKETDAVEVLRADKDVKARFDEEMSKDYSPLLLDEVRGRTGARLPGEAVLDLREKR
jgi:hypothetical protein